MGADKVGGAAAVSQPVPSDIPAGGPLTPVLKPDGTLLVQDAGKRPIMEMLKAWTGEPKNMAAYKAAYQALIGQGVDKKVVEELLARAICGGCQPALDLGVGLVPEKTNTVTMPNADAFTGQVGAMVKDIAARTDAAKSGGDGNAAAPAGPPPFVEPTTKADQQTRLGKVEQQLAPLREQLGAATDDDSKKKLQAQMQPLLVEQARLKQFDAVFALGMPAPAEPHTPEQTADTIKTADPWIKSWHTQMTGNGLQQMKSFCKQAGIDPADVDRFILYGELSPALMQLLAETKQPPGAALGKDAADYHAKVQISLFLYEVADRRLTAEAQKLDATKDKTDEAKARRAELGDAKKALAAARADEVKVTSAFYTRQAGDIQRNASDSYNRAGAAQRDVDAKKKALDGMAPGDPKRAAAQQALDKVEAQALALKAQGDRMSGILATGYKTQAAHVKAGGNTTLADDLYGKAAGFSLMGADTELGFRQSDIGPKPPKPIISATRDPKTGAVTAPGNIPQVEDARATLALVSPDGQKTPAYHAVAGRVDRFDGLVGAAALGKTAFNPTFTAAENDELAKIGAETNPTVKQERIRAFSERMANQRLAGIAGLPIEEQARIKALIISKCYANVSAFNHFAAGAKILDDKAKLTDPKHPLGKEDQQLLATLHGERDRQAAVVMSDAGMFAAAKRRADAGKQSLVDDLADTPGLLNPDQAKKLLADKEEAQKKHAGKWDKREWVPGIGRSGDSMDQDAIDLMEVEKLRNTYNLSLKVQAGNATPQEIAQYRVAQASLDARIARATLDQKCDGDSKKFDNAMAAGRAIAAGTKKPDDVVAKTDPDTNTQNLQGLDVAKADAALAARQQALDDAKKKAGFQTTQGADIEAGILKDAGATLQPAYDQIIATYGSAQAKAAFTGPEIDMNRREAEKRFQDDLKRVYGDKAPIPGQRSFGVDDRLALVVGDLAAQSIDIAKATPGLAPTTVADIAAGAIDGQRAVTQHDQKRTLEERGLARASNQQADGLYQQQSDQEKGVKITKAGIDTDETAGAVVNGLFGFYARPGHTGPGNAVVEWLFDTEDQRKLLAQQTAEVDRTGSRARLAQHDAFVHDRAGAELEIHTHKSIRQEADFMAVFDGAVARMDRTPDNDRYRMQGVQYHGDFSVRAAGVGDIALATDSLTKARGIIRADIVDHAHQAVSEQQLAGYAWRTQLAAEGAGPQGWRKYGPEGLHLQESAFTKEEMVALGKLVPSLQLDADKSYGGMTKGGAKIGDDLKSAHDDAVAAKKSFDDMVIARDNFIKVELPKRIREQEAKARAALEEGRLRTTVEAYATVHWFFKALGYMGEMRDTKTGEVTNLHSLIVDWHDMDANDSRGWIGKVSRDSQGAAAGLAAQYDALMKQNPPNFAEAEALMTCALSAAALMSDRSDSSGYAIGGQLMKGLPPGLVGPLSFLASQDPALAALRYGGDLEAGFYDVGISTEMLRGMDAASKHFDGHLQFLRENRKLAMLVQELGVQALIIALTAGLGSGAGSAGSAAAEGATGAGVFAEGAAAGANVARTATGLRAAVQATTWARVTMQALQRIPQFARAMEASATFARSASWMVHTLTGGAHMLVVGALQGAASEAYAAIVGPHSEAAEIGSGLIGVIPLMEVANIGAPKMPHVPNASFWEREATSFRGLVKTIGLTWTDIFVRQVVIERVAERNPKRAEFLESVWHYAGNPFMVGASGAGDHVASEKRAAQDAARALMPKNGPPELHAELTRIMTKHYSTYGAHEKVTRAQVDEQLAEVRTTIDKYNATAREKGKAPVSDEQFTAFRDTTVSQWALSHALGTTHTASNIDKPIKPAEYEKVRAELEANLKTVKPSPDQAVVDRQLLPFAARTLIGTKPGTPEHAEALRTIYDLMPHEGTDKMAPDQLGMTHASILQDMGLPKEVVGAAAAYAQARGMLREHQLTPQQEHVVATALSASTAKESVGQISDRVGKAAREAGVPAEKADKIASDRGKVEANSRAQTAFEEITLRANGLPVPGKPELRRLKTDEARTERAKALAALGKDLAEAKMPDSDIAQYLGTLAEGMARKEVALMRDPQRAIAEYKKVLAQYGEAAAGLDQAKCAAEFAADHALLSLEIPEGQRPKPAELEAKIKAMYGDSVDPAAVRTVVERRIVEREAKIAVLSALPEHARSKGVVTVALAHAEGLQGSRPLTADSAKKACDELATNLQKAPASLTPEAAKEVADIERSRLAAELVGQKGLKPPSAGTPAAEAKAYWTELQAQMSATGAPKEHLDRAQAESVEQLVLSRLAARIGMDPAEYRKAVEADAAEIFGEKVTIAAEGPLATALAHTQAIQATLHEKVLGPAKAANDTPAAPAAKTPIDEAKAHADAMPEGADKARVMQMLTDIAAIRDPALREQALKELKDCDNADDLIALSHSVPIQAGTVVAHRLPPSAGEGLAAKAINKEPRPVMGGFPKTTPEQLAKKGLEPHYTIEVEGVKFHVSEPFQMADGRVGMMAVIEHQVDGKTVFEQRALYRSNSQASWRVCPESPNDSVFGKAGGEGEVLLPIEVSGALHRIAARGLHELPSKEGTSAITSTEQAAFEKARARDPALSEAGFVADYRAREAFFGVVAFPKSYVFQESHLGVDPISAQFDHDGVALEAYHPDAHPRDPKGMQLLPEGLRPDFSKAPVDSYSYDNPNYGALNDGNATVKMRVYESRDGSLRYLIAEDAHGRINIAGVETKGGEINGFGTRKQNVDLAGRDAPLVEYEAQIAKTYGGKPGEEYASNWALVSQIPEVVMFYHEQGRLPPGVSEAQFKERLGALGVTPRESYGNSVAAEPVKAAPPAPVTALKSSPTTERQWQDHVNAIHDPKELSATVNLLAEARAQSPEHAEMVKRMIGAGVSREAVRVAFEDSKGITGEGLTALLSSPSFRQQHPAACNIAALDFALAPFDLQLAKLLADKGAVFARQSSELDKRGAAKTGFDPVRDPEIQSVLLRSWGVSYEKRNGPIAGDNALILDSALAQGKPAFLYVEGANGVPHMVTVRAAEGGGYRIFDPATGTHVVSREDLAAGKYPSSVAGEGKVLALVAPQEPVVPYTEPSPALVKQYQALHDQARISAFNEKAGNSPKADWLVQRAALAEAESTRADATPAEKQAAWTEKEVIARLAKSGDGPAAEYGAEVLAGLKQGKFESTEAFAARKTQTLELLSKLLPPEQVKDTAQLAQAREKVKLLADAQRGSLDQCALAPDGLVASLAASGEHFAPADLQEGAFYIGLAKERFPAAYEKLFTAKTDGERAAAFKEILAVGRKEAPVETGVNVQGVGVREIYENSVDGRKFTLEVGSVVKSGDQIGKIDHFRTNAKGETEAVIVPLDFKMGNVMLGFNAVPWRSLRPAEAPLPPTQRAAPAARPEPPPPPPKVEPVKIDRGRTDTDIVSASGKRIARLDPVQVPGQLPGERWVLNSVNAEHGTATVLLDRLNGKMVTREIPLDQLQAINSLRRGADVFFFQDHSQVAGTLREITGDKAIVQLPNGEVRELPATAVQPKRGAFNRYDAVTLGGLPGEVVQVVDANHVMVQTSDGRNQVVSADQLVKTNPLYAGREVTVTYGGRTAKGEITGVRGDAVMVTFPGGEVVTYPKSDVAFSKGEAQLYGAPTATPQAAARFFDPATAQRLMGSPAHAGTVNLICEVGARDPALGKAAAELFARYGGDPRMVTKLRSALIAGDGASIKLLTELSQQYGTIYARYSEALQAQPPNAQRAAALADALRAFDAGMTEVLAEPQTAASRELTQRLASAKEPGERIELLRQRAPNAERPMAGEVRVRGVHPPEDPPGTPPRKAFGALDTPERVAAFVGPGPNRATPDAAAVAQVVAKARRGEPLTPAESGLLCSQIAFGARSAMWQTHTGEYKLDPSKNIYAPEHIGGWCGFGQAAAATYIHDLVPGAKAYPYQAGAIFGAGSASHAFLVVELPGGQRFLVDPTVAQFYNPKEATGNKIGAVGLRTPADGVAIMDTLKREGFLPLTDKVAAIYGEVIGNKKGMTAADFFPSADHTPPTMALDFSPDKLRPGLPVLPEAKVEAPRSPEPKRAADIPGMPPIPAAELPAPPPGTVHTPETLRYAAFKESLRRAGFKDVDNDAAVRAQYAKTKNANPDSLFAGPGFPPVGKAYDIHPMADLLVAGVGRPGGPRVGFVMPVEVHNMAGINSAKKSQSAADQAIAGMYKIQMEAVRQAVTELGGKIETFRDGGKVYEFITFPEGDPVKLQAALSEKMKQAQAKVDDFVKAQGLDKIPHARLEGDAAIKYGGTHLDISITLIDPARSGAANLEAADATQAASLRMQPESGSGQAALRPHPIDGPAVLFDALHEPLLDGSVNGDTYSSVAVKRRAFIEGMPGIPAAKAGALFDSLQLRDGVLGIMPSEERAATTRHVLDRMPAGSRAFYGEVDIGNLKGLTQYLERTYGKELGRKLADGVFAHATKLFHDRMVAAARANGGEVHFFRKGGDEIGAVIVFPPGHEGNSKQVTQLALLDAQADVRTWMQHARVEAEVGGKKVATDIREITHPKHPDSPGKDGIALTFGLSELDPKKSLGENFFTADANVEAQKKKPGLLFVREEIAGKMGVPEQKCPACALEIFRLELAQANPKTRLPVAELRQKQAAIFEKYGARKAAVEDYFAASGAVGKLSLVATSAGVKEGSAGAAAKRLSEINADSKLTARQKFEAKRDALIGFGAAPVQASAVLAKGRDVAVSDPQAYSSAYDANEKAYVQASLKKPQDTAAMTAAKGNRELLERIGDVPDRAQADALMARYNKGTPAERTTMLSELRAQAPSAASAAPVVAPVVAPIVARAAKDLPEAKAALEALGAAVAKMPSGPDRAQLEKTIDQIGGLKDPLMRRAALKLLAEANGDPAAALKLVRGDKSLILDGKDGGGWIAKFKRFIGLDKPATVGVAGRAARAVDAAGLSSPRVRDATKAVLEEVGDIKALSDPHELEARVYLRLTTSGLEPASAAKIAHAAFMESVLDANVDYSQSPKPKIGAAVDMPKDMRPVFEGVAKRFFDPKFARESMVKLYEEVAQELEKQPEGASPEARGRAALLKVLVRRAKDAGLITGEPGARPMALHDQLGTKEFLAVLAKGNVFFDFGLGATNHGIDSHLLQLALIGPYLNEALAGRTTAPRNAKEFVQWAATFPDNGVWGPLFDSLESSGLATPSHLDKVVKAAFTSDAFAGEQGLKRSDLRDKRAMTKPELDQFQTELAAAAKEPDAKKRAANDEAVRKEWRGLAAVGNRLPVELRAQFGAELVAARKSGSMDAFNRKWPAVAEGAVWVDAMGPLLRAAAGPADAAKVDALVGAVTKAPAGPERDAALALLAKIAVAGSPETQRSLLQALALCSTPADVVALTKSPVAANAQAAKRADSAVSDLVTDETVTQPSGKEMRAIYDAYADYANGGTKDPAQLQARLYLRLIETGMPRREAATLAHELSAREPVPVARPAPPPVVATPAAKPAAKPGPAMPLAQPDQLQKRPNIDGIDPLYGGSIPHTYKAIEGLPSPHNMTVRAALDRTLARVKDPAQIRDVIAAVGELAESAAMANKGGGPARMTPANLERTLGVFEGLGLSSASDLHQIVDLFGRREMNSGDPARDARLAELNAKFTDQLPQIMSGVKPQGEAQGRAVLQLLRRTHELVTERVAADQKTLAPNPTELRACAVMLANMTPAGAAEQAHIALALGSDSFASIALIDHYRRKVQPGQDSTLVATALETVALIGGPDRRAQALKVTDDLIKLGRPPTGPELAAIMSKHGASAPLMEHHADLVALTRHPAFEQIRPELAAVAAANPELVAVLLAGFGDSAHMLLRPNDLDALASISKSLAPESAVSLRYRLQSIADPTERLVAARTVIDEYLARQVGKKRPTLVEVFKVVSERLAAMEDPQQRNAILDRLANAPLMLARDAVDVHAPSVPAGTKLDTPEGIVIAARQYAFKNMVTLGALLRENPNAFLSLRAVFAVEMRRQEPTLTDSQIYDRTLVAGRAMRELLLAQHTTLVPGVTVIAPAGMDPRVVSLQLWAAEAMLRRSGVDFTKDPQVLFLTPSGVGDLNHLRPGFAGAPVGEAHVTVRVGDGVNHYTFAPSDDPSAIVHELAHILDKKGAVKVDTLFGGREGQTLSEWLEKVHLARGATAPSDVAKQNVRELAAESMRLYFDAPNELKQKDPLLFLALDSALGVRSYDHLDAATKLALKASLTKLSSPEAVSFLLDAAAQGTPQARSAMIFVERYPNVSLKGLSPATIDAILAAGGNSSAPPAHKFTNADAAEFARQWQLAPPAKADVLLKLAKLADRALAVEVLRALKLRDDPVRMMAISQALGQGAPQTRDVLKHLADPKWKPSITPSAPAKTGRLITDEALPFKDRLVSADPKLQAALDSFMASERDPKKLAMVARALEVSPEAAKALVEHFRPRDGDAPGDASFNGVTAALINANVPGAFVTVRAVLEPVSLRPEQAARALQLVATLPIALQGPFARAIGSAKDSSVRQVLLNALIERRAGIEAGNATALQELRIICDNSAHVTDAYELMALTRAISVVGHEAPALLERLEGLSTSGLSAEARAKLLQVRFGEGATLRTLADGLGQPPSLDSIRAGVPGKIRGEAQLNSDDVRRLFDAQLARIEPTQVDGIVAGFAPAQDAARTVLARISRYGSIEGLNALAAGLRGEKIFVMSGSLSENLSYLSQKGSFGDGFGQSFAMSRTIEPGITVIVDEAVIHRLQTDPAFAKQVVDAKCKLVFPRGFEAGINLFNGSSPEAIAKITGTVMKRAQALSKELNIPLEAAVERALDESMHQRLTAVDPALLKQVIVVEPGATDPSNGSIARQLNGDAGMTAGDIEAAVADLPAHLRPYARELVAQTAQVYSPRRLANIMRSQNERILALAKQNGVKPENIYYVVPRDQKSYGMMALTHRSVTGTPADHYIQLGEAQKLPKGSMVVVLDDVAGSGSSLRDVALDLKNGGTKAQVVIAPVLTSQAAADRLNKTGVTYLPGELAPTLQASPFFQKLPEADRRLLLRITGDLGYGDNGMAVAFPYMAPDNNNQFFGTRLAPAFIMNKNKRASKQSGYYPPSD